MLFYCASQIRVTRRIWELVFAWDGSDRFLVAGVGVGVGAGAAYGFGMNKEKGVEGKC